MVCDGEGGGGGGEGGVEDVNCAAVGFNYKIINRFNKMTPDPFFTFCYISGTTSGYNWPVGLILKT